MKKRKRKRYGNRCSIFQKQNNLVIAHQDKHLIWLDMLMLKKTYKINEMKKKIIHSCPSKLIHPI
jgi:hypothetical protein